MTIALVIDYVSIGCAAALAVATMFKAGRSFPRWAFVAGMGLLAIEATCLMLTNRATAPEDVTRWQSWRLVIVALLPATWIAFSATYARGKDRVPSRATVAGLLLASLLPCAATLFFRHHLVASAQLVDWETEWRLRWAWGGTLVSIFMLVAAVAVVVNLERTFRASVGATRWRIKYMLLGIGLLFVVRIYTSSQSVLFQGADSSIETINAIALIVGAALTTRSLYRTGHF